MTSQLKQGSQGRPALCSHDPSTATATATPVKGRFGDSSICSTPYC